MSDEPSRKMGRPRKTVGDVKMCMLSVRTTLDEREGIEWAAQQSGMTASEWARKILREAADAVSSPRRWPALTAFRSGDEVEWDMHPPLGVARGVVTRTVNGRVYIRPEKGGKGELWFDAPEVPRRLRLATRR